jgi:oxalate decarboxylase
MAHKLFFSLSTLQPQFKTPGGSLTYVTAQEVPGFVDISYAQLILKPRGSVEPLWHPNAHKIGYCTSGYVLVSMRTPHGAETFTVQNGEIFFIPEGYVHHIENIGSADAYISFALNHTKPETMYLSKAIYSIANSVFNSTFNTSNSFFDGLKQNKSSTIIHVLQPLQNTIEPISSRFKFDIQSSTKTILTKGGYLQTGIKNNLPILQGLGILGFGLNPQGIVEPHWHTNAGELVYIVKGTTRITVLSPDGSIEKLEVKAGEGAFAPASHFHNIENIGTEDVEVIAFFNDENPDYLGIGEVMGSYSNELLASIFNVAPAYFDSFKKPDGPLVIVPVK